MEAADYLAYKLVLLYVCVCSVTSQTISEVNALSSSLMQGYNVNTRPVANQKDLLPINLTMSFSRIRDFEEVEGRLSTVFVINLTWTDYSLTWNASEHGNITSLTMSESSVWKPELLILNAYGKLPEIGDHIRGTVRYTSNGEALWQFVADFETICNLDTTYFPLDVQGCQIQIAFKGYSSQEVDLASTLNTRLYNKHGTWKMMNAKTHCTASICLVAMELERQPEFIIINLVFPILTLALLNPLVFLLPVESGERIGFAITDLLSLSVFMTLLGDYLPRNSNTITLLSYMLMVLFAQSSVILILVIVGLWMYHSTEGLPIPAPYLWLVTLSKWLSSSKCKVCHRNRKVKSMNADNQGVDRGNETEYIPKLDEMDHHGEKGEEKVDPFDYGKHLGEHTKQDITWRDVSTVTDKLYVYVMYTVDTVVVVTFLVYMAVNGKTPSDM